MDLSTFDFTIAIEIFLLLLIGVGPKIALVPFLEMTAKMDKPIRDKVVRKMLRTAAITAVLLMLFGGLLTRLLHFSTGALAIAGGIILLVIDVVVFRWAERVGAHLDESRMLVTEKVFGFLLAALAVQLALDGLADLGVIHLVGH